MHLSDRLFTGDDLLPLSGLQHLLFCGRQWASIHIERQRDENRLTQEGRVLRERVHGYGTDQSRPVGARGLKPSWILTSQFSRRVAPRRGAWIETAQSRQSDQCRLVAPRTGA
jgi:hypothetical protein